MDTAVYCFLMNVFNVFIKMKKHVFCVFYLQINVLTSMPKNCA